MMISNYVLEHLDSCDKDTLHAICKELLAYREPERAIWENAPEWANWFARDSDGQGFYYSEEPDRGPGIWRKGGRSETMYDEYWRSTLQERPK